MLLQNFLANVQHLKKKLSNEIFFNFTAVLCTVELKKWLGFFGVFFYLTLKIYLIQADKSSSIISKSGWVFFLFFFYLTLKIYLIQAYKSSSIISKSGWVFFVFFFNLTLKIYLIQADKSSSIISKKWLFFLGFFCIYH